MYQITQEVPFCYGHRLHNYQGKCARLHGHNGVAMIVLRSTGLDRQGMVVDFIDIERKVRGYIDETLDHRLLLHRDDPVIPALRALGEPFLAVDENPTAENLARMIFEFVAREGFPVLEVRLRETEGSYAAYSPDH